jgi:DNA-binding NarL/FixJ family response regulator
MKIEDILFCFTGGKTIECRSYQDIPDAVIQIVEPIISRSKKIQKGLMQLVGSDWDKMVFQYISCRFSGNDYFTDIENNIINFEFSDCDKRGSCPAEKCICRFNDLTPREIEIVKLIAQGYCDKEIAHMLHISTYTMPVHRRNIHHKLETLSKPQIAAWAVKHNIF